MVKRITAEILAVLSALLITAFTAAILGGLVGVVFLPVFLIGGVYFYILVRAWMRDVFELRFQSKPPEQS
ncbi:MAG: hypothetical protein WAV47_21875 [Blastocatellia bacterium]